MARVNKINHIPPIEKEITCRPPERLIAHSFRIWKSWIPLLQEKAKEMSRIEGKKIRISDLIREATYQAWIKK